MCPMTGLMQPSACKPREALAQPCMRARCVCLVMRRSTSVLAEGRTSFRYCLRCPGRCSVQVLPVGAKVVVQCEVLDVWHELAEERPDCGQATGCGRAFRDRDPLAATHRLTQKQDARPCCAVLVDGVPETIAMKSSWW